MKLVSLIFLSLFLALNGYSAGLTVSTTNGVAYGLTENGTTTNKGDLTFPNDVKISGPNGYILFVSTNTGVTALNDSYSESFINHSILSGALYIRLKSSVLHEAFIEAQTNGGTAYIRTEDATLGVKTAITMTNGVVTFPYNANFQSNVYISAFEYAGNMATTNNLYFYGLSYPAFFQPNANVAAQGRAGIELSTNFFAQGVFGSSLFDADFTVAARTNRNTILGNASKTNYLRGVTIANIAQSTNSSGAIPLFVGDVTTYTYAPTNLAAGVTATVGSTIFIGTNQSFGALTGTAAIAQIPTAFPTNQGTLTINGIVVSTGAQGQTVASGVTITFGTNIITTGTATFGKTVTSKDQNWTLSNGATFQVTNIFSGATLLKASSYLEIDSPQTTTFATAGAEKVSIGSSAINMVSTLVYGICSSSSDPATAVDVSWDRASAGNFRVNTNLFTRGTGTFTNGISSYRTNYTTIAADTVGQTNTTGIAEVWNISGTSGTFAYWFRTGAQGQTPGGVALWTNTVIASGNDYIVGANCGIQFMTGVGTVISRRPFP